MSVPRHAHVGWVLLAAACGSPGTAPTDGPGAAVGIEIELPVPRMQVGAPLQASARVVDAEGRQRTDRQVTWLSEDAGVASVDQFGVITGVAVGTARIVARSLELEAGVTVEVIPRRVARVETRTPKANVVWGSSTRVVATAFDGQGNVMVPGSLAWRSSWPDVVQVDQDGIATGVATGQAWIVATADGVRDSTPVVSTFPAVTSAFLAPGTGTTLSLGRQLFPDLLHFDDAGDLHPVQTRYASSDSSIVRPDVFILNALAPGVARISSTNSGPTVAFDLRVVEQPRVESVRLTPDRAVVPVGQPVIVMMQTLDETGQILTDRDKTVTVRHWSSLSLATYRTNGDTLVFVGAQPGTYRIRREVENRETAVEITVLPSDPSSALCRSLAGATLLGDDGQFLGTLTPPESARSIQAPEGYFGGWWSSTSVYSLFGPYGRVPSDLSAFDPGATRPPFIVRDGVTLGRASVSIDIPGAISPGQLLHCDFR